MSTTELRMINTYCYEAIVQSRCNAWCVLGVHSLTTYLAMHAPFKYTRRSIKKNNLHKLTPTNLSFYYLEPWSHVHYFPLRKAMGIFSVLGIFFLDELIRSRGACNPWPPPCSRIKEEPFINMPTFEWWTTIIIQNLYVFHWCTWHRPSSQERKKMQRLSSI
jgi:hypothetical protein